MVPLLEICAARTHYRNIKAKVAKTQSKPIQKSVIKHCVRWPLSLHTYTTICQTRTLKTIPNWSQALHEQVDHPQQGNNSGWLISGQYPRVYNHLANAFDTLILINILLLTSNSHIKGPSLAFFQASIISTTVTMKHCIDLKKLVELYHSQQELILPVKIDAIILVMDWRRQISRSALKMLVQPWISPFAFQIFVGI